MDREFITDIRWKVTTWEEWADGCDFPLRKESEPKLQVKIRKESSAGAWEEAGWVDVRTEMVPY